MVSGHLDFVLVFNPLRMPEMLYRFFMGSFGEQIKCEVCGTSFERQVGGKPQKYCSPKCRQVAKSRKFRADNPAYGDKYRKPKKVFVDKPCKYCGLRFTPIRNNHVYCSENCSIMAIRDANKVLATCRECGARFSQTIKNQRYCERCKQQQRVDRSQNNEIKARLYKETKHCLVCDQVFTAYRSTSLYCSKVCGGISRRKRVRENNTLSIREIECQYCSKSFTQKHPHQKFCSRSCSQMNWHYTQRGQDKRFWTTYRLRYETVEAILETQGNACAICGFSFSGARKSAVHVDHDHSCCATVPTCGNCNRGLICGNCNTMLGMAKDNIEILRKAADYLQTAKLPSPEHHLPEKVE
jgi:predicted nucleic acid-binding Zn ribbon protein